MSNLNKRISLNFNHCGVRVDLTEEIEGKVDNSRDSRELSRNLNASVTETIEELKDNLEMNFQDFLSEDIGASLSSPTSSAISSTFVDNINSLTSEFQPSEEPSRSSADIMASIKVSDFDDQNILYSFVDFRDLENYILTGELANYEVINLNNAEDNLRVENQENAQKTDSLSDATDI